MLCSDYLNAEWNGHDWVGEGSVWLNQCRRMPTGWLRFAWPQRMIIQKAPQRVSIEFAAEKELSNNEKTMIREQRYVPPVADFRILGLKPGDTIQGVIFHE